MAKRIMLIVAAALIVAGAALFVVTMAVNHWDFSLLDYAKREVVTREVREDFDLIQIDTDTADLMLLPSEDGGCRVVCDETEHESYSVTVSNNTLLIRKKDQRAWYEFLSFGRQSKLIVYLPKSAYTSLLVSESTGNVEIPKDFAFETVNIAVSTGDVACYASASGTVQIAASTGDITVAGVFAGDISLAVSTGKVTVSDVSCTGDLRIAVSTGRTELTDVKCRNLTSTGSTGRITLKNVIASGKLSVERDTGDVSFDRCDAGELWVKTDTGDVTGTLRTEKIFFPKTDTGDVRVPQTTTGGKCEITTSTGDIEIELAK